MNMNKRALNDKSKGIKNFVINSKETANPQNLNSKESLSDACLVTQYEHPNILQSNSFNSLDH